jgi:hypothetical protein
MSRTPDLSAFPIPRKGGAKPIAGGDVDETKGGAGQGADTEQPHSFTSPAAIPPPEDRAVMRAADEARAASGAPLSVRPIQAPPSPNPPAPAYGQVVATTVKLDENRYLRLMEAGRPGPGRLRRRTIQDMLIEALDEWFERRQL